MTTEEAFERLRQATVDVRSACLTKPKGCAREAMQDAFRAYWGLQRHEDPGVRAFAERFDRLYWQAADLILF